MGVAILCSQLKTKLHKIATQDSPNFFDKKSYKYITMKSKTPIIGHITLLRLAVAVSRMAKRIVNCFKAAEHFGDSRKEKIKGIYLSNKCVSESIIKANSTWEYLLFYAKGH